MASAALIAARRQRVSSLLLRGLSQREIKKALERQRVINPDTRKPWSLATINSDIQALESDWEAKSLEATHKRKSRVQAGIEELRRQAWAQGDLPLVRLLYKDEIDLHNLNTPMDPMQIQLLLGLQGQAQLGAGDEELARMDEEDLDHFIANMLIATGMEEFIEGEYEEVVDG